MSASNFSTQAGPLGRVLDRSPKDSDLTELRQIVGDVHDFAGDELAVGACPS